MEKQGFCEYIVGDVLANVSGVTSKRMFGGYGLYKDGVIFAIITKESKLYFKVGDSNQKYFEELGSKPFVYEFKQGKKGQMPYWELPQEIMEDSDEVVSWVERSVLVSKEAKKWYV